MIYFVLLHPGDEENICEAGKFEDPEEARAYARVFAEALNERVGIYDYYNRKLEFAEPEGGVQPLYGVYIETAGPPPSLAEFSRRFRAEDAEAEADRIAAALRRIRRGKNPATRVVVKQVKTEEIKHEAVVRPAGAEGRRKNGLV